MPLPDAAARHPLILDDGVAHPQMVHLATVIDHPNIDVGAFTYANDFEPPADWAARLAPYLYPGGPERLVVGRFCQIAHGVRFITASANHAMDGLSTYPFAIFDPAARREWVRGLDGVRDTMIGHDVWIGHGALILPGAAVGDGAIIGAGAVVAGAVAPYTIVAGNPARPVRRRLSPKDASRMQRIGWWHWPVDRIERAVPALMADDIDRLERLA